MSEKKHDHVEAGHEVQAAGYGPDARPMGKPAETGGDAAKPQDQAAPGPVAEMKLSEEELAGLCKAHVCPHCAVMQEAQADKLRALADTDNLRKRLERETAELRKYAGETVLADLLPVLDNLDLALAHGRNVEACKDFVLGVDMTRKVFLDTLRTHGLEASGKAGEAFDPKLHEAVGMGADPSQPDGAVLSVMQSGYVLKGRLLRPAKVMVNKIS